MPTSSHDIDTRSWPKKERIAYAREIAAIRREELRMRKRRNRMLRVAAICTVTLVILGSAGLALYNQWKQGFAGPLNMLSDGILLTSDGTTVTPTSTARIEPDADPVATDISSYADTTTYIALYVDYDDADSATFMTTNAEQIGSWLTSAYIALEVHPIAASGSDYSERAANAAACVANGAPDSFIAVNDALFTAAAEDGFDGLSNDELSALISTAGVTDTDVLSCVTGNTFANWVAAETARAQAAIPNADVTAATTLPTILVDQTSYTGAFDDADAFTDFISSLYATDDDATTDDDTSTDEDAG
jgi:hypothetical protein